MIYPGRSHLQCMTHNLPWFRVDVMPALFTDDTENWVMGGSALDAPSYIPSGSTTTSPSLRPYTVMVREVPRES
jgi:hypothetical protein